MRTEKITLYLLRDFLLKSPRGGMICVDLHCEYHFFHVSASTLLSLPVLNLLPIFIYLFTVEIILKIKFFYYHIVSGIAAIIPSLSIYLKAKGIGADEMALLGFLTPLLALFVKPFIAFLADKTGWHRSVCSCKNFSLETHW